MSARTGCTPTMVCPDTGRIIAPGWRLQDARVECPHCNRVHRLDEVVAR
ncbi:hypothetical protein G9C85_02745 [Halorubellus sp. JP-L1]|nr:hypothetical protein [Halorubellus sp. JP-L1]NHN40556.1 hypothetical protein [Halorubellus sp. JP-L1]